MPSQHPPPPHTHSGRCKHGRPSLGGGPGQSGCPSGRGAGGPPQRAQRPPRPAEDEFTLFSQRLQNLLFDGMYLQDQQLEFSGPKKREWKTFIYVLMGGAGCETAPACGGVEITRRALLRKGRLSQRWGSRCNDPCVLENLAVLKSTRTAAPAIWKAAVCISGRAPFMVSKDSACGRSELASTKVKTGLPRLSSKGTPQQISVS